MKALRKYAEELEAERDAPFDPKAAGILVPTAVERPEGRRGAGRKRLSDLHGSVTMREWEEEDGPHCYDDGGPLEGCGLPRHKR